MQFLKSCLILFFSILIGGEINPQPKRKDSPKNHSAKKMKSTSASPKAELVWPAQGILTSTFGESRLDHFHGAIDIAGSQKKIVSMAKGRIIWIFEKPFKPGKLPSGYGKMVVVEHPEFSGRLISSYMHLDSIEKGIFEVAAGEKIGVMGNTGHSGGVHLDFAVMDLNSGVKINPLKLLPEKINNNQHTPHRPRVEGWGVDLDGKLQRLNIDSEFRLTKERNLFVELSHLGLRGQRWGIYSLKAWAGDKKTRDVTFDHLIFTKGHWQAGDGSSFEKLYQGRFINLGKGFREHKLLKIETRGYQSPTMRLEKKLKITEN